MFRAFCFKIRKSTCNIALRVRVGESQQPTCFSCALWCEGSCVPRSWWAAKDGSLSTWWKHVLRSRSFRVVKELSLGWRTKETNFQLIFRPVSSSSNKIITFQKATCLFHNKCKIWHFGLKCIQYSLFTCFLKISDDCNKQTATRSYYISGICIPGMISM